MEKFWGGNSEMHLNEFVEFCGDHNRRMGFKDDPDLPFHYNALRSLALIGTEVSEAINELRDLPFDRERYNAEVADIIIRTFDLCARDDNLHDVERVVMEKMAENNKRPFMYGKRF